MAVPTVQASRHYDKLHFSRLVFGTMRLTSWGANMSAEQIADLLDKCAELGITTIDSADIYGDHGVEIVIGEAFKLRPGLRERLTIVTKCGIIHPCQARQENKMNMYDSSKEHILRSVDTSLRDFQTSYIDVLLIHRPDFLMEVAEIAAAFKDLHSSGKVHHFGVSNFSTSQFCLLQSALLPAGIHLVTNQVEISPLHLEAFLDGTLDQCIQVGMVAMAWSPYGGGQIFKGDDERSRRLREALEEVGRAHDNASSDLVILAWLLRHPANICPILGTTNIHRLEDATRACSINLSRYEWYKILEAARGHRVA